MHIAYRAATPKQIRDMYHHLASNAIYGLKIRIDIPMSVSIQEREVVLPAIDGLKNYNKKGLGLNFF